MALDSSMADQQSNGISTPEKMAADRYQVVRGAFWWRVKVGNGQQTVGRCYTQAEAERLAAALRAAFLDGAFVVAQQVAAERERCAKLCESVASDLENAEEDAQALSTGAQSCADQIRAGA